MKKTISVMLTLILSICMLTACSGSSGSGASIEVYTAESVYIEAGYEGDTWNAVEETLILNSDGTYVRTEDTFIIQYSGVVVTYWTYTMEGTYEKGEESDGVKSVTLSAPTEVSYNINGSFTTSSEDSALLDYAGETTLDLDTDTLKYTVD